MSVDSGGQLKWRRAYGLYALMVFFFAVWLRTRIFSYPIDEGDELIYKALVEQLHHGRGYTLQGHPLLLAPWMAKAQYDTAVFYHPPFAVYFFWGVAKLTGMRLWSLQLSQLVSFSLFYWSMLGFMRSAVPELRRCRLAPLLLPPLVALTPIYAHTNMHVWIDNPRLAFFCLHAALLFRAGGAEGKIPRPYWALLPLTSLAATLTRVDSLTAYAFLYLLAAFRFRETRSRAFFGALAGMLALNLAAACSWLLYSDALRVGSGKPTAALMATNAFVRSTLDLGVADFLLDYLKESATLVPATLVLVAALLLKRKPGPERAQRAIALAWVYGHWALYGILGIFGFSKVLRYVGMATPACLLVFGYALVDGRPLLADQRLRWGSAILGAFLLLGYGAELFQGVAAILRYGHLPWIRPPY